MKFSYLEEKKLYMAPNSLQPPLKFYVLLILLRAHEAVKTRVKLTFTASYLPARSMVLDGVRYSTTSWRGNFVKYLQPLSLTFVTFLQANYYGFMPILIYKQGTWELYGEGGYHRCLSSGSLKLSPGWFLVQIVMDEEVSSRSNPPEFLKFSFADYNFAIPLNSHILSSELCGSTYQAARNQSLGFIPHQELGW